MPNNLFCFYIYTRNSTFLNLARIALYFPHGAFHHCKTTKVITKILKACFIEELLAKIFESAAPEASRAGLQLGGVRLAVLTWVAVARTGTVSFH